MKEESLLLLSDLQKLINQVVLIDYTIIILGGKKKKRAGCNRYKRYYSRLTFSNKKEPSILVNTRLLGST